MNDSAGVVVNLYDKSERSTTTIGYRSAAAIEADRGLCNTPTLITNTNDYVKVFGTPNVKRHGKAAIEAYWLSSQGVPQVLTRVKNPMMTPDKTPFGAFIFNVDGSGNVNITKTVAKSIVAPTGDNTAVLYTKGEGDYFKGDDDTTNEPFNYTNVVYRFSKPETESEYADSKRVLKLDIYDFNGARHIDTNTNGVFEFTDDISSVIGVGGTIQVDGYNVTITDEYDLTLYINGISKTAKVSSSDNLYDVIATILASGVEANGSEILAAEAFIQDDEAKNKYILQANTTNGLSLYIDVSAKITGTVAEDITDRFYSEPGTNISIKNKNVTINLSTSLKLTKASEYMYLGATGENWAQQYVSYLAESHVFSFSYDDFDASYTSLQADSVLSSSNYVVSKSTDTFEYAEVSSNVMGLTKNVSGLSSNEVPQASKSYAYSSALTGLLMDNLTTWRCVVTPNLGDVMGSGDFVSAITAAGESTLGLSNVGLSASYDYNKGVGHGYRFIADYCQYMSLIINSRKTWVPVSTLVVNLLNTNYNNGNEARPPFGYNYGKLVGNELSQVLTGPQRKAAAGKKFNPVNLDGGFFLWEELTSQVKDSSLSDIHSILSYIYIKYSIYDAMKNYVAEYNDKDTISRGLSVLKDLNRSFITNNYIDEGIPSADKNVLGDVIIRFSYAVKFKGVGRFVYVDITAYKQTQSLAISLSEG